MAKTLADAAHKLNSHNARRGAEMAVPHLVLVIDARQTDPVALAMGLPRGAAVLLRPYAVADAVVLGQRLGAVCRRRGLVFLISGDVSLAVKLKADGLHLPEGQGRHGLLSRALRWHRAKPGRYLSMACHGQAALTRAARLGADFGLVSPVFATRSHPGAPTLGSIRLSRLIAVADVPVLALGGVTPLTARQLIHTRVCGLAAIDGFSI